MGIDLCQGRRIDFTRIGESTLRVKANWLQCRRIDPKAKRPVCRSSVWTREERKKRFERDSTSWQRSPPFTYHIISEQAGQIPVQFENSAQFKTGRSLEFLLSNARDSRGDARDSRGDVGRLETPYCLFSSRLSDVQVVILLKAKNSRLVLFPFHRDRQWQIDYCKPEREQGKDYMRKKMQSKSQILRPEFLKS